MKKIGDKVRSMRKSGQSHKQALAAALKPKRKKKSKKHMGY